MRLNCLFVEIISQRLFWTYIVPNLSSPLLSIWPQPTIFLVPLFLRPDFLSLEAYSTSVIPCILKQLSISSNNSSVSHDSQLQELRVSVEAHDFIPWLRFIWWWRRWRVHHCQPVGNSWGSKCVCAHMYVCVWVRAHAYGGEKTYPSERWTTNPNTYVGRYQLHTTTSFRPPLFVLHTILPSPTE